MSVAQHDVSRRDRELPRLERVVVPRWLRQRRRAQARAARRAVVADMADQVAGRTTAGREATLEEIIRAQGVKPFDADEHRHRRSLLSSEDWAELRAALAQAREQ